MINALRAVFPGVEEESGVIYARLSASGAEFRVEPEGGIWVLSLSWPVRGSEAQRATWMAVHPGAEMDIHQGETRLRLRISRPEDLPHWAALAEAAVVAMVGWRRKQRAPGEGM